MQLEVDGDRKVDYENDEKFEICKENESEIIQHESKFDHTENYEDIDYQFDENSLKIELPKSELFQCNEYDKSFLGSSATSLEELCRAFTIFPNQGQNIESIYLISSIAFANNFVII